jgi:hypothetical protein
MVGAVALLVDMLLAAVRGTAARGHDARRATDRCQRKAAFIDRDRDTRLEHQQRADGAPVQPDGNATRFHRNPLPSRDRQPITTGRVDGYRSLGL